jgi:hypothetical protein
MSELQTLPATDTDAQQHFLDSQTSLFLFDLKNEAIEHGFKTGDTWNLQLVTDGEIKQLKDLHRPVIALRLQPHALLTVFKQVKTKLQQSFSKDDDAITVNDLAVNEKKFLAAYRAGSSRS